MLESYIEIIKPYVQYLFKKDSGGHDIGHLTRTMEIARKLCKEENGDELIVCIAAFMHDVHRLMQTQVGHFVSPKDSIPIIREILSHTDLTEENKNKICFCIENHENYNWNGNNVNDINALILQDADNLEAIGAIGIARAFAYGGANSIKMYDELVPLEDDKFFSEETAVYPSMLHHFYHKLFKLGDYMNTNTAKKIAEQRTQFMKEFALEFLDEWNCIK